mgnify:FL=1
MSEVIYESKNNIAIITINREQAKNAMNWATVSQLHDAWQRFAASDDRVAILTGAGPHFCAGADVRDMPDNILMAMPNLSVPCDKPVIAAVSGYVIGAGSSLVMMSDMCVAASDAKFIYPEAKVGAFAGLMGGFPSRMPYKAGMQWTLTGDPMSAQRAYEIGFVNALCEPGEQLDHALALAQKIALNAPLVVKALKSLAKQTMAKGPVEKAFQNGMMLQGIRSSVGYEEGLTAIREKRNPNFTGA